MKIIKIGLIVVMCIIFFRLLIYAVLPPKIELTFSRGDTVYEFAQILGVNSKHLMYYNNIKNPRTIAVGTKIKAPIPVLPYLRFRMGFDKRTATSMKPSPAQTPPLVYSESQDITGTIFFSPSVRPHPNPKIYCGKHMIIGNLFLTFPEDGVLMPQKFNYIEDGNKLRMYELAGENPIMCPVRTRSIDAYELSEVLLPLFVSIWNNYRLHEKPILFYRGDL